jgi:putative pyruvate formate lyase activating enzyme
MKFSRREFIRDSILAGSGLLLFPASPRAEIIQRVQWHPGYAKLEEEGKLTQRVKQAYAIFERCQLCPRRCGVNRLKGEKGFCQAPARAVIYSAHPHFGEEEPITGEHGSGTIFISNCNLRCVFCQNWPIAHEGQGREVSDEEFAGMMLGLQKIRCHNINIVTPTHVMPNILGAIQIACRKGLRIPLFYNTSGYERVEILKILDGIVDIYKPDMKYSDGALAEKYSSGARDYPEVARKAILEMHRQVGVLKSDENGFALQGLLIRHLVMPNRIAGTEELVKWVSENLPRNTYVNIMAQYRVEYKAYEYPELARGITVQEFLEAIDWAQEYGLINLDSRSLAIKKIYDRRRSGH